LALESFKKPELYSFPPFLSIFSLSSINFSEEVNLSSPSLSSSFAFNNLSQPSASSASPSFNFFSSFMSFSSPVFNFSLASSILFLTSLSFFSPSKRGAGQIFFFPTPFLFFLIF